MDLRKLQILSLQTILLLLLLFSNPNPDPDPDPLTKGVAVAKWSHYTRLSNYLRDAAVPYDSRQPSHHCHHYLTTTHPILLRYF